jgi:phospholipid-binding lipoprotein MlaA
MAHLVFPAVKTSLLGMTFKAFDGAKVSTTGRLSESPYCSPKAFLSLLITATLALSVLLPCAHAQSAPANSTERSPVPNPKDPFESFNRSVTTFNDRVDQALLQPVARTYVKVTPDILQTGVKNFFGNLADVWSTVNNALQLKPQETVESLARVGVNTILGVGGVIDWASKMGIDRHTEDFGQTLGHWGVGSGPYLVLPLLGPSTLRDTVSLTMDFNGNPTHRVKPASARYELMGLNLVSKRAQYLGLGDELNDLALDRYSFLRDVYLQKRLSDVWDGNPPEDTEESGQDPQGDPTQPVSPAPLESTSQAPAAP